MKPECEEIIKGTDKRFVGKISPIKTMIIDCSTCLSDPDDCKWVDELTKISEYKMCTHDNHFNLWMPRKRDYFCKGCSEFGTLGCYQNTNENDFAWIKCCKHAEPCSRNYLVYPENQLFIKRLDDWKVVRCDKEGNKIKWED